MSGEWAFPVPEGLLEALAQRLADLLAQRLSSAREYGRRLARCGYGSRVHQYHARGDPLGDQARAVPREARKRARPLHASRTRHLRHRRQAMNLCTTCGEDFGSVTAFDATASANTPICIRLSARMGGGASPLRDGREGLPDEQSKPLEPLTARHGACTC